MSGPNKTVGRFTNIEDAVANTERNLPSDKKVYRLVVPDRRTNQANGGLFELADFEGTRWNKLYPYQLIVVEKEGGGWKESGLNWKFTLPINPQSLEIDMPFAITTSATLGGVIEEHNGAPFRMINISATTGILPLKGAGETVGNSNFVQGIFAGTIAAATTAVSSLTRSESPANIVPNTEFDGKGGSISKTSGYYQYHLLKEFFEAYATFKKTEVGRKARLAFAMWKDNSVYLVTPMMFKLARSSDSPFEYRFNLSLKAFGRIKLGSVLDPAEASPLGRDPNKIAQVLNSLRAVRVFIEDSKKILQAVRGDINAALFTPLKEITLALKGMAGHATTLADLPSEIAKDSKESTVALLGSESNQTTSTTPSKVLDKVAKEHADKIKALSAKTGKSKTGAGRQKGAGKTLSGADPANKILDNPDDNFSTFSAIDVAGLKLPPSVQRKIQEEKRRVAAFTRKDFEIRRDSIVSVMVDFAEAVGLGSETFNRIYGIHPRTTSTTKTATDDDFDIVFNLNKIITEVNRLCVSNRIDPNSTDASEYIAGLARRSGIAFTEPRSKFLVPFLVGHTLEEMAKRYLGDANRWHEIATLNGLHEPYVDEVGFDIFLSTNGSGNSVQVSDATNLFIGQFVYISSSTVRNERRQITGITKITDGINIVNLSGEGDLDKLTVIGQSKLHAYLPDTVNSQMSIYIPSQDDPHLEDFLVKPIQGIDYFDNLIRVGGISLLLNSNNDIALTADGRSRLAIGLTNIVQKARIALSTVRGSLLQHPSYGLPVSVGESTADVSAKAVLKSIQEMFSKDPSFSTITSASVLKSGGTSSITVNIGIAGTAQVIPITAEIRR